MSICNDATNIPTAHPCGYGPSGTGYIAIAPGDSTLHWSAYMSVGYSGGYAQLVSASLMVDNQWLVATTPLPGAALLFATALAVVFVGQKIHQWGVGASSPTDTSGVSRVTPPANSGERSATAHLSPLPTAFGDSLRDQHCRIAAQQPADIAMQIVHRCDEYRR